MRFLSNLRHLFPWHREGDDDDDNDDDAQRQKKRDTDISVAEYLFIPVR